jgi:crotonobetainyl-CoA:carnitine CoA-transferase CaiB-like acyl-CoA transferase
MIGPFYKDRVDPEKSLFWYAFNANKRGITLDIQTADGRQIFKQLAAGAQFVIESFDPGFLDGLDLGYPSLSTINPGLVMAAITPFGQSGPYRNLKGPDIVCMAMSGQMWLSGDQDRAPLRVSIPQAFLHAGAEAAVGALMAHWHRELTGEGQYVDVSAQESVSWECFNAQAVWDLLGVDLKREGIFRQFGPYKARYIYPCKDGQAIFLMVGGHIGAKGQQALVEWMDREGMADDYLRNFDWSCFDAYTYTDEVARKLEPQFAEFFKTKTKAELLEANIKLGALLAPMNTVADVVEGPQFTVRECFAQVEHPELDTTVTYPYAPYKSSELLQKIVRRAPLIGEHNDEIYIEELGLSRARLGRLTGAGVI